MSEVQIAAEKAWLIMSTCIIVVMSVGAIAVLVWWIIQNAIDAKREKNRERDYNKEMLEHFCDTNAAAADAGWGNYIDMKKKYDKLSNDYADYKTRVAQWDDSRSGRIKQLEDQLHNNNIEPVAWEIPS